MRIATVCAFALVLVSCEDGRKPITDDEIIAEHKKCEANGMRVEVSVGTEGQIINMHCVP